MIATTLRPTATLALLTLLAACGSSQSTSTAAADPNATAADEADPEPNRSVNRPGGHVTFGFRATPRGDTDRVKLVGVLVDLEGEEHVTDLGEWEGELTAVGTEEGELIHLHLTGPEEHEFVAIPVGDDELHLLIDGRRVHRLELEAAARLEADEPLRLNPPRLLEPTD